MLRHLGVVFVFALFLVACEHKGALAPADQTYTLRAVVTGLPNPPKQALRLHHEAIPTFVGQDGKVEGMEEMEMEFPFLAPSARLDGTQVGDKVEVTMEMRWKSKPRFQLTKIEKLPADTELKLGKITEESAGKNPG